MPEYDVALDTKTDWISFWCSEKGQTIWNLISEQMSNNRAAKGESWPEPYSQYEHEELLITLSALIHSDCYYWSRDMLELVTQASISLPETWSVSKQHVPSVSGFFYFARDTKNAIAGLAWNVLTMDEKLMQHIQNVGLPMAVHIQGEDGSIPDFNALSLTFFYRHPDLRVPMPCRTTLYVGESLKEWRKNIALAAIEINADPKDFDFDDELKLFGTMLSFLQQKIMVHSKESVSRATRKRALENNQLVKPEVNVVRLRKTNYQQKPDVEGREIDWSCRWIVHGHWRNQWYATEEKHHPVFIAPFVKGPEGKPLKDPGRLFAVVR